eukprot:scaffold76157_cov21-Tisochrysis_lutea.AAC.1
MKRERHQRNTHALLRMPVVSQQRTTFNTEMTVSMSYLGVIILQQQIKFAEQHPSLPEYVAMLPLQAGKETLLGRSLLPRLCPSA